MVKSEAQSLDRIFHALSDSTRRAVGHAVEAFKAIPNADLAVIPDAGHFALFSEPQRAVPVIEHLFLKNLKPKL